VVLEQGGLAPGGLNFDCKVRRESTELRDMFVAHIGAMDTMARGLRVAAKILQDGVIPRFVKVSVEVKVNVEVTVIFQCFAL
jgi:xylose isomerase